MRGVGLAEADKLRSREANVRAPFTGSEPDYFEVPAPWLGCTGGSSAMKRGL